MQQHPLIRLGEPKNVTHLGRRPTVDVAQRDDVALLRWQPRDRISDEAERLVREQARLRQALPALGRRSPVVAPAVIGVEKAVRVNGGLARRILLVRKSRERDAASLAGHPLLRAVERDPEEPGLERGPPLEPVEALQEAQPRVLHDLLRHRPIANVEGDEAEDGGAVAIHQSGEGLLVSVPKGVQRLEVTGRRGGTLGVLVVLAGLGAECDAHTLIAHRDFHPTSPVVTYKLATGLLKQRRPTRERTRVDELIAGRVPLDRLWHAVPAFPTVSEVWLRLLEAYGP